MTIELQPLPYSYPAISSNTPGGGDSNQNAFWNRLATTIVQAFQFMAGVVNNDLGAIEAEFTANETELAAHATAIATLEGEVGGTQPKFGAYFTTPPTIPNNAFTTLIFDTVEFDVGSCYDDTTGKFQPTVAGYYHLGFNVTYNLTGTVVIAAAIYKNGASHKQTTLNNPQAVWVDDLLEFNGTTDFATFEAYQASGVSTVADTGANLCRAYAHKVP